MDEIHTISLFNTGKMQRIADIIATAGANQIRNESVPTHNSYVGSRQTRRVFYSKGQDLVTYSIIIYAVDNYHILCS